MTVKELIAELQKIEDKTLDVTIRVDCGTTTDIEVLESEEYYYKDDTYKTRDCIILIP